jgi:hypothetical protein
MLAVKPPEDIGGHHPSPWIELRNSFGHAPAGESETVETELHIPTSPELGVDPWDLAGWITLIIRMKSNAWPEVRLSSYKPFSECGQNEPISLYGEVSTRSRMRGDVLGEAVSAEQSLGHSIKTSLLFSNRR